MGVGVRGDDNSSPEMVKRNRAGKGRKKKKKIPRNLLLQRRSMTGSFNLNSVHSGPRKDKIWSPHWSICRKSTTKLIWVMRPQTCFPPLRLKAYGEGYSQRKNKSIWKIFKFTAWKHYQCSFVNRVLQSEAKKKLNIQEVIKKKRFFQETEVLALNIF